MILIPIVGVIPPNISVWCNGSMVVSKTTGRGSIPRIGVNQIISNRSACSYTKRLY